MMKGIIKTEGVTGLYRGLPGIWIKDIPGSFLYFGSYELAKSTIRHFKQSQHLGKFPFIPARLMGLAVRLRNTLKASVTQWRIQNFTDFLSLGQNLLFGQIFLKPARK